MELSEETRRALARRVRNQARFLATRRRVDVAEAEQMIWLGICERAAGSEEFLDQTPSYIVCGGFLAAKSDLNREMYRDSHLRTEFAPREMEDGTSVPGWELLPDTTRDPARIVPFWVMVEELPDRQRFIAEALQVGYQKQEIAAVLGLSPARVGQIARHDIVKNLELRPSP